MGRYFLIINPVAIRHRLVLGYFIVKGRQKTEIILQFLHFSKKVAAFPPKTIEGQK